MHVPAGPRREAHLGGQAAVMVPARPLDSGAATRVRIARSVWVVAFAAAWWSSGFTPVVDAVTGARVPSDFATDFVPAARIGHPASAPAASPTRVDVATGNAATARFGAAPYADVGVPFGAHPPTALLLVAALVPLGFTGAAGAWLLLSLLALAVVAWVVTEAVAVPAWARGLLAVVAYAALILWPPVLHNIEKGQWSMLIGGLLAAAWWARTRGHYRTVGTLIAVAGLFKIMPFLALLAFVGGPPSRRRQVLTGAAVTLVIAAAMALVIVGPQAWSDFLRAAPLNTRGWQTGPGNTLSLWGALARLLIGGPFAEPLAAAKRHPTAGLWAARLVWTAAALALAAVAARLTMKRGAAAPVATDGTASGAATKEEHELRHDEIAFAAWCTLAVVLGPLSWSHTAVFLLVPLSLLAKGVAAVSPRLGERGRVARPLLAVAVVALTVPRATLFATAGALPLTPSGGSLLCLHLAAALAIFSVAVSRAE